jgi:hypothetical protein
MTICTERKLLERLGKALEVAVPNLQTATTWREDDPEYRQVDDALAAWEHARAFLADIPACDAEKAVLVKLVEEQAAERHRWGGHAADGFGQEWRNCQSVLCQKARDVLADPSPAAAALLAQGEKLTTALVEIDESLLPLRETALGSGPCEDVEKQCAWCSEVYRHTVEVLERLQSVARAALAPGEETE